MCGQKKLDADPKGIQEIEFVRKLHNNDGENANGTQFLFILTASEKIKETRLKFLRESVKSYEKWQIIKNEVLD